MNVGLDISLVVVYGGESQNNNSRHTLGHDLALTLTQWRRAIYVLAAVGTGSHSTGQSRSPHRVSNHLPVLLLVQGNSS